MADFLWRIGHQVQPGQILSARIQISHFTR
jgi:hypothetical protein